MRIETKTVAALVAACVLAVQPLASLTVADSRRSWAESSARELRSLLSSEVPGSELGDWPLAVEETLFALFRKTELHRGKLSVRFVRSDPIFAEIYPDATIVVSTGLLDYIDVTLFDRMASSSRRVRSLEREREEALLPFLAPLAAETALDFAFATSELARESATGARGEHKRRVPDRQLADRMTMAMLSLAGYETKPFSDFLRELTLPGVSPALKDWAARFPAAKTRLASLESSAESVSRLTAELAALVSAAGTRADTRDILASAEAVGALAGDIPYLSRLQALALHRSWLSGVAPSDALLITHLPVASELDRSAEAYASFVSGIPEKGAEALATARPVAFATPSPVPGDTRAFALAVESYGRARSALSDGALDSAYARLLAFSPTVEARKDALSIALSAGESEEDADSPVARANLAALLYYAGANRERALAIATRFALPLDGAPGTGAGVNAGATVKRKPTGYVRVGYPCDARDISINLALMLKSSGEAKKADEYVSRARGLSADARAVPSPARASFRRLVPGDSVDSLVTFWGKPASIAYNYYSEWWEYPSLKARVLVTRESDGKEIARFIALGAGSPVSPGGNVRVGDSLEDFEAEFGRPAYMAADSAAYLSGGARITVLAPYGSIRSISAGY